MGIAALEPDFVFLKDIFDISGFGRIFERKD